MQTHTYQSLPHDSLTRSLREYKIPHEEETITAFRAGAGPSQGCLRMDIVTHHGALFKDKTGYKSSALLFGVNIANPLGPTALTRTGMWAGFALEEAIKERKPTMTEPSVLYTNSYPLLSLCVMFNHPPSKP